jgi:hypothetical protein
MGARARKLPTICRWACAVCSLAGAGLFSAVWLGGAELTPEAPAVSATNVVFTHEPATPVSEVFRRRIEDATTTLPEGVWRSLWQAGWRVQLAEFVTDAAPALTGERPRGWPSGLTWENTDAVNLPSRRLVVVAEKRRNRQGEVVPAERIEGVFRHELGHAYDRAAGGKLRFRSAHPEFMAAYASDQRSLAHAERSPLAYYLQGDAAGRQEAFAEAFAIVLGGGSDPLKRDAFIRAFPRVMAHLESTLAAETTELQTAGK